MRKKILMIAGIIAILATPLTQIALAQSLTDGQVTKIDESAGKISLRHGPMKKLDMEDPMTMVYRVQDPAMLKQVKVGDKVKFDADRVNGALTVTKIEKVK